MNGKAVRRTAALVLAAAVLGMASCDEESKKDEEARDQARLKQMKAEIIGLVGDAVCQDSLQCGAIGLGQKPCGGPWSYLIFSTATVDTVKLYDLVEHYNAYEQYMNLKYGYYSDCMVPRYPTLGCRDGHCADVWTGP